MCVCMNTPCIVVVLQHLHGHQEGKKKTQLSFSVNTSAEVRHCIRGRVLRKRLLICIFVNCFSQCLFLCYTSGLVTAVCVWIITSLHNWCCTCFCPCFYAALCSLFLSASSVTLDSWPAETTEPSPKILA